MVGSRKSSQPDRNPEVSSQAADKNIITRLEIVEQAKREDGDICRCPVDRDPLPVVARIKWIALEGS